MKLPLKLFLAAVASAGLGFCVLSSMGVTDSLCFAKGCEVYKVYAIGGISLYWIGAAAFLILGVTLLFSGGDKALLFLTGLVLAGSFVFLIVQFLLWPCTNCLMVAALLGIFAWGLAGRAGFFFRVLCMVWLLLFSSNLFMLARESIPPWPVLGKNNADIQVFFSPTCPACRKVVEKIFQNPGAASSVAFYPLAKDDKDRQKLEILVQNLRQGIPAEEALADHWKPLDRQNAHDRDWKITFNLWRNQLHLAKKGADQVPLVVSRDVFAAGSDPSRKSLPDGCSIFTPDSEGCEDEQPADPFESIFE